MPVRGEKTGARAEKPLKTLLRVLSLTFGKRKRKVLLMILCIVVSAFVSVYSSNFLGRFIDNNIIPIIGKTGVNWKEVMMPLREYFVVTIIAVTFNVILSRMMVGISQNTLYDIRKNMFKNLQTLPISFFDSQPHGTIMSTFSNDTDTLNHMISQSLVQLMQSAITAVMLFSAMVANSLTMTGIVILFIFLILLSSKTIGGRSRKEFSNQQNTLSEVNGFVEEMVNGERVVKVFCHEEKSIAEFDKLNEKLYKATVNANAFGNVMGPVNMNLGNLQYVVITILGAVLVIKSGIYTIGLLASFLLLSKAFSNNVNQVSMQMTTVLQALAGAERIFKIIDEESEKDQGYVELVQCEEDGDGNIVESDVWTGKWAWRHPHKAEGTVTYTRLKGDIVFEDVDFAYTEGKTVLHDISLYAHPGEKIAFVGATGAGKTTITNLLNRFYDIKDGKIRFDGINIMKIKKRDLRRSLGMILQDTNLFTGTIKDNIKFGKKDATDEEVEEAAKLANAHNFIMMMEKGYDTEITGDGESLSQGQRQLLSIARAALVNPPVLVMDEATSSIDTNTEKLVQGGMDRLMEGRTVFVIAHRLSTVKNSNAIMVLEKGKIIERGNHESLIREKGYYYRLYTGDLEIS